MMRRRLAQPAMAVPAFPLWASKRVSRVARQLATAAVVGGLAAPACGGSWSFATDTPLLLGGSVVGSFSGSDADADLQLAAAELTSFSVSYIGAPPATSSFSIDGLQLGAGDRFSFDLAAGALSFSASDAIGRSISGGSFEFTAVVGNGAEVDSGGMLTVTAVPEPASGVLLLAGLAVLRCAALRRRRQHTPGAAV